MNMMTQPHPSPQPTMVAHDAGKLTAEFDDGHLPLIVDFEPTPSGYAISRVSRMTAEGERAAMVGQFTKAMGGAA